MKTKYHPEKVIPGLARIALERAKDNKCVYSEYVRGHWQQTGSLDTGCNNADLIVWYQMNMPTEFASKEIKKQRKQV